MYKVGRRIPRCSRKRGKNARQPLRRLHGGSCAAFRGVCKGNREARSTLEESSSALVPVRALSSVNSRCIPLSIPRVSNHQLCLSNWNSRRSPSPTIASARTYTLTFARRPAILRHRRISDFHTIFFLLPSVFGFWVVAACWLLICFEKEVSERREVCVLESDGYWNRFLVALEK